MVLRSDEFREVQFGVAATDRLPTEACRPAILRQVYETLFRRAESILNAGHAVIADALFLDPANRAAIEAVAKRAGVPFRALWLTAAPDILEARVAVRRNDASDATVDVLRRQLETAPGPLTWYTLEAGLRPDDVLQRARAAAIKQTVWPRRAHRLGGAAEN